MYEERPEADYPENSHGEGYVGEENVTETDNAVFTPGQSPEKRTRQYMGAVPGNEGWGDAMRVPPSFSSSTALVQSADEVLYLLPPPPEEPEDSRHVALQETDVDISPLSTESTPQSPPTPQCVPQGEGGEGGQVLFRLVAPGGGKESKEEKERDPGKTLRTPPLKLRPTPTVSPERRFTPYQSQSPRTPTTPLTPLFSTKREPAVATEPSGLESPVQVAEEALGPPWLDAWSSGIDWQVKQQGHGNGAGRSQTGGNTN